VAEAAKHRNHSDTEAPDEGLDVGLCLDMHELSNTNSGKVRHRVLKSLLTVILVLYISLALDIHPLLAFPLLWQELLSRDQIVFHSPADIEAMRAVKRGNDRERDACVPLGA
jgi:hypothetical protein